MTLALWPEPLRGGLWGVTLSSPHGRAARLTLSGDTAGRKLDIVVKKCAAAASGRRAPYHAPAPKAGALALLQASLTVEEYVRGEAREPPRVGSVRSQSFRQICRDHQAFSQGELRRRVSGVCMLMTIFEEGSML
jgi:hypothetical protein